MRIRTDYVTNSSSSSFIVGFKSKDDVKEQLGNELYIGRNFDRVLKDILKNHISKDEALHIFKDEMYWDARFIIEREYERKLGWREFYNWIEAPENKTAFENAVKERVNVWFSEFKQKIEGLEYLSLVEYSDHVDGDLEHEVMPRLDCTIQRFSHH